MRKGSTDSCLIAGTVLFKERLHLKDGLPGLERKDLLEWELLPENLFLLDECSRPTCFKPSINYPRGVVSPTSFVRGDEHPSTLLLETRVCRSIPSGFPSAEPTTLVPNLRPLFMAVYRYF